MIALALGLTLGMGGVVIAFASRSLRHEAYRTRFLARATALVLAASVMVITSDLVVLAAAWVLSSALAVAVVRTGPNAARTGARMRSALLVGDAAMVAAVAVTVAGTESRAIADVGRLDTTEATVAGLLLVVAALTRAATMPFHRWLPDTLGAPTPSSALLHAGVVNGGAVVLIKLTDLVATPIAVAAAAVAAGAVSCVLAEAIMLRRPDVKGRLAWSTIAQMSFTLVLCGLGLTTAAAVHLFGHGLYKGALFLGSGSAVRAIARRRSPQGAAVGVRAPAMAFTVTGAGALVGLALSGGDIDAGLALGIGLAWVTAGTAATAWLRATAGGRGAAAGLGAAAVVTAAFVLVAAQLKDAVAPTIEATDPALPAVLVLPLLAALVLLALAPSERLAAWARRAGRPLPAVPSRLSTLR